MKFKYRNLALALTVSGALALTGCTNAAYRTTNNAPRPAAASTRTTGRAARNAGTVTNTGRAYNRPAYNPNPNADVIPGIGRAANRAANRAVNRTANRAYYPEGGYDNMAGSLRQGTPNRGYGANYGTNGVNNNVFNTDAVNRGYYTAGHNPRGGMSGMNRGTEVSNAAVNATGIGSVNRGLNVAGTTRLTGSENNTVTHAAAPRGTATRTGRSATANVTNNTAATTGNVRNTAAATGNVRNTAATTGNVRNTASTKNTGTAARTAARTVNRTGNAGARNNTNAAASQTQPQIVIIAGNNVTPGNIDETAMNRTTARNTARVGRANRTTGSTSRTNRVNRTVANNTMNTNRVGGTTAITRTGQQNGYYNGIPSVRKGYVVKAVIPSSQEEIRRASDEAHGMVNARANAGRVVRSGISRYGINRNTAANNTTARNVATNPDTTVNRSNANTTRVSRSSLNGNTVNRASSTNINNVSRRAQARAERAINRTDRAARRAENLELGSENERTRVRSRRIGLDNENTVRNTDVNRNTLTNVQAANPGGVETSGLSAAGLVNRDYNANMANQYGYDQFGNQYANQYGINRIGGNYGMGGVNQYGENPYTTGGMSTRYGLNRFIGQYGTNRYGTNRYGTYDNTGLNFRNVVNDNYFRGYGQTVPENTGMGYYNPEYGYGNYGAGYNNSFNYGGYRGIGVNRGATNTIGNVRNNITLPTRDTGLNIQDKNALRTLTPARGAEQTGRDITNGSRIRTTRGTSISR